MDRDLEPIAENPDSAAEMTLEVSMTVTRGGRPLDIEILESPENISGHQLRKLKRILSDMRFRPRLSNGLPAETQGFVWHIPLKLLDLSP